MYEWEGGLFSRFFRTHDEGTYTAGTFIRLGKKALCAHFGILVIFMSIGNRSRFQFKCKGSFKAAFRKALGIIIPICDTVKRRQMQIIMPSDNTLGRLDSEVVVNVRCKKPVTVKCKQITGTVIAHLMPGIPTIADIFAIDKALKQRREILLSLSVLKRDLHAVFLGFVNHTPVSLKTCVRRNVRNIVKTDKGVRDHNGSAVFHTGMNTVNKLFFGFPGFLAIIFRNTVSHMSAAPP